MLSHDRVPRLGKRWAGLYFSRLLVGNDRFPIEIIPARCDFSVNSPAELSMNCGDRPHQCDSSKFAGKVPCDVEKTGWWHGRFPGRATRQRLRLLLLFDIGQIHVAYTGRGRVHIDTELQTAARRVGYHAGRSCRVVECDRERIASNVGRIRRICCNERRRRDRAQVEQVVVIHGSRDVRHAIREDLSDEVEEVDRCCGRHVPSP